MGESGANYILTFYLLEYATAHSIFPGKTKKTKKRKKERKKERKK